MGFRETEKNTELVLERMENTLNNLEQMSFDSINITDRLVTLLNNAREYASIMKDGTEKEREEAFDNLCGVLNQLLDTAFLVNNVSHELEIETVYQRDTLSTIKQIVDFIYSMADDLD